MEMVLCGDALEQLRALEAESVHTCVTSPPYYNLRDYGVTGQIGREATPEEYIGKLVDVFREVRRCLRPDGTLWVNIGDSYATSSGPQAPTNTRNKYGHTSKRIPNGYKKKDLIGIPWMLAFALRNDGWYLRQDIIWHKTNSMPENAGDRCVKSHEYIFLLSRSADYYFDASAIREISNAKNGSRRNKRSVWSVATGGAKTAHCASFPERLIEPCILAGCPEGGTVLDPFAGSGTTGVVAKRLRRNFVGVEINPDYCEMATVRIAETAVELDQITMNESWLVYRRKPEEGET